MSWRGGSRLCATHRHEELANNQGQLMARPAELNNPCIGGLYQAGAAPGLLCAWESASVGENLSSCTVAEIFVCEYRDSEACATRGCGAM